MYYFPSALALLTAMSAGLILALSSNVASSAENCERLEALAVQYAGVELTRGQKQLKQRMIIWYSTHCIVHADR